MPVVRLTVAAVKNLQCDKNKKKENYFDTLCKGLMLEIRVSGGKTWYARYYNSHGKLRHYKIANAEQLSLKEARNICKEIIAKSLTGLDPVEKRNQLKKVLTFSEFIEQHYLPHAMIYKRSWKNDAALLKNHILPFLKEKYLDKISKQDIVNIHQQRLFAGAAPASANRVLTLLSRIFNLALQWEMSGILKNPVKGISLFTENNIRDYYLTSKQWHNLEMAMEQTPHPMLRNIITMLVLTGARRQEVLEAKWSDIDIQCKLWRIPMSKSGKARYVPLSKQVLALLANMPKYEQCSFIFPNPKTKKPYTCLFWIWNRVRRKAGLPNLRLHDLRHSFASFLINAGRSLYEVQKILGHSNLQMTQRYAHLSKETLLEAVDMAGSLIYSTERKKQKKFEKIC
ncbi:site-specific integrase [Aquaspirillum serpens]|uniref:site-specific integrase n=1 Tax=Aquaspirillum serpens TaxID=190 RepID=UPI0003B316BF|nr:site-specific integrase [Aquaspirillum serpens]